MIRDSGLLFWPTPCKDDLKCSWTYACFGICSRYEERLRSEVWEVEFNVVWEPVSARCDAVDVTFEGCTRAITSKSSSSADSANRVKSNFRWMIVKPEQTTKTHSAYMGARKTADYRIVLKQKKKTSLRTHNKWHGNATFELNREYEKA